MSRGGVPTWIQREGDGGPEKVGIGTQRERKGERELRKGLGIEAREKEKRERDKMILAWSHRNQQGREVKETTEGKNDIQPANGKEEE